MTKTKTILGISFAAAFVFSMVLIPAYAGGHVFIDKTEVKVKNLEISKVDIKVTAKIPKDGSSAAFGYGIFTSDGFDNVLVNSCLISAIRAWICLALSPAFFNLSERVLSSEVRVRLFELAAA